MGSVWKAGVDAGDDITRGTRIVEADGDAQVSKHDSIWLPNTVIDDSVSVKRLDSEASQMGCVKGYEERETPWLEGVGTQFNLPLIPEEQWNERIRDREAKGLTNRQLREHLGIQSLNQNGYPFCWAHGPTQALRYLKAQNGEPVPMYSACSVACPVTNFRTVGGWGDMALDYIRQNGINTADDWPINSLDRRLLNDENREKARLNRVTEWFDLRPRGFPEIVTCLLYGMPVSVAFNWWRHLVCAIDAVLKGGEVCLLIDNSWGNWGDNGLGVISGRKKFADEQIAPRVINASSQVQGAMA